MAVSKFRRMFTLMKFTGTDNYVASDDLKMAVNAAVTLERPLLIKGEPGTGKTMLAVEVAKSLNRPLFQPPRRSKGSMSTTRFPGCATRNWAKTRFMTLPTTLCVDRFGKRSSRNRRRLC
jgi:hypothetical protein